jgi:biotin synthase
MGGGKTSLKGAPFKGLESILFTGEGVPFEKALEISQLKPDQGHKNGGGKSFNPHGCLKIIAVYRCIHPRRDIFICGGREIYLRDLQPLMFMAGANGTMVGNYFTTCGRPAEEDITVIKDLGLRVKQ